MFSFFTVAYEWIFKPSSRDSTDLWLLKAFLRNFIVLVPIVILLALGNSLIELLIVENDVYIPLKVLDLAGLWTIVGIYLKRLLCDILEEITGRKICP